MAASLAVCLWPWQPERMSWLTRHIERIMRRAEARGDLSGLEGEGQALPKRPEAALVDPALAASMRIMAEAGAVPEEFNLAKALEAARKRYAAAGPKDRRAIMTEIADLEKRWNMAREARRKFLAD